MDDDKYEVYFVTAKSWVALLKELNTIPRLELQAAVMAVLNATIKEQTTLKISETVFMTDSTI